MRRTSGFTLIELIVFIVVMGITAVSALIAINLTLSKSHQATNILRASQLADARMQLILLNSFSNVYSDPCGGGSPPAACTLLINFATAQGLVVTPTFSTTGNVVTVTVTVTGSGNSSVSMRIYK